jgi:hypothetical protein
MDRQHNGMVARAVQVNATGVVGANAALTVTIPALAGWVNVLTGYDYVGTGATAAAVVDITTTGVGANYTSKLAVPASPTSLAERSVRFPNGLTATANNTAITVNVPALGVGNLSGNLVVYGYRVRG